MTKTIKAMIAETPLIKNLSNPEYVNIILNGRPSLEERFADIDIHMVRKELSNDQSGTGKIPAKIKKLIKDPNLPETLVALFGG